jgi:hypothetical protein
VHVASSSRLVVLLLLAVLGVARAEDERLAGSKLVLRENTKAEHLVLVAREGVLAPLPGGTEDPTRVGAVLEISNPRTGERARFETVAADWTVNAVGTVFRFRNHLEKGAGSEVRGIVIRHQRRLKISTRALGITLDEETQRALSVVLTTGTRRYCLLFGGKIGKDKPGRFAARNAPAPIACPAPVAATSTTTTTTRPAGSRPTSTSVTSSTNVTNSTSATSSTWATSVPATLPVGTTTTSTTRVGGSTSTTNKVVVPTTTTSRPPTTTTTRQPTTTTRPSTTTTRQPTTSTRQPTTTTSTSSSTTKPPPPPTTTSTAPPPPTTSSTSPPPPTTSTSTTRVTTTSTTSTTDRPCGLRGNLQCRGACPAGLKCGGFLVCSCR